jgi:DNA-binding NtrC family response regulator
MSIYSEFIGCQSPLVISFIDRDAQVCRAIHHALAARGHDVGIFPSAAQFMCSGAIGLADILILAGTDHSISEQAPLYSGARERPNLPTIVITKYGLEARPLSTVSRSMPHMWERPKPCERLALLCSFLCRIGLMARS